MSEGGHEVFPGGGALKRAAALPDGGAIEQDVGGGTATLKGDGGTTF